MARPIAFVSNPSESDKNLIPAPAPPEYLPQAYRTIRRKRTKNVPKMGRCLENVSSALFEVTSSMTRNLLPSHGHH